jgi:glucose/arabinose dehydrogenase
MKLTELLSGLASPTFLAPLPDAGVLLVLEQPGRVRKIVDGVLDDEPFLDLTDRIHAGGERGLLGLALHPSFSSNGLFYLHYSARGEPSAGIELGAGVVSEFVRRAGALAADPGSERRLMVIPQPYSNHNGGMLAFHPSDGFLYIGLGDGGSRGDPQGNGQNLATWLGKLLRIDVNGRDAGEYGIPAGNMTGDGVRPEIWSYGLRNPWRFSFDADTGDLYIGDVGQNAVEEIDFAPSGAGQRNYGWNTMEGSSCYEPRSGCDREGLALPVLDYPHDFGCSVTGGYVYRGQAIAGLRGTYLFADYCTGRFGALRVENERLVLRAEITSTINPSGLRNITSFGVDQSGELYVLTGEGGVYRVDPN